MGRDALPLVIENALAIVTEFGKEEERERRRLSTRGYNHSFAIVVIEFKFFHCHPGFDVIETSLHGEEDRSGIC